MRFKLDENIGSRTAHLFPEAGHDIETIFNEGLSGANDEVILETCIREGRCLVSLDLDFADVVRFPSHRTAGIAVLRLPNDVSLRLMERLVRDLLRLLKTEPIVGRLWTVEAGRIRVRDNKNVEPSGGS